MVSPVRASEALARLDPLERELIETFRREVRARFGPRIRDLRLFGSKVRGDDHEESDIDLLVLVDIGDPEIEEAIREVASSLSYAMRPLILEFDAYHAPVSRASGFYREMRKESVRL